MIAGVDAPTPSHREESEAVRPRGNKVYILGHVLSGPRVKIDSLFLIWSLVVTRVSDSQGLLYRWTKHSADFFPKITTEGRKMATKITPRGWIFWTMTFYHLKKFTSRST